MIKVENVCLKFTKEFYALFDVSFEIENGEKVALVGADDSGKTTILRVLAKLEDFVSGQVYIKDIDLRKLDFKNDIVMGYIPATPVFMERKTVRQNFEFVLKNSNLSKYDITQKINEILIENGLEKLLDEKIKNISLFEKYLLSILRLSLKDSELVLVDNVFDNVTAEEETILKDVIKKYLLKNSTTALVATTKSEIADKLCSRTIKFNLGSIEKQEMTK